jgi:hypothetical protein
MKTPEQILEAVKDRAEAAKEVQAKITAHQKATLAYIDEITARLDAHFDAHLEVLPLDPAKYRP